VGTINAFDGIGAINVKSTIKRSANASAQLIHGNIARLIGPAISGIILEKMGAETCFLINAIKFFIVDILCLLFIYEVAKVFSSNSTH